MDVAERMTGKATVKLTKLDANGNVIEVTEQQIELTEKEMKQLWGSQQQE